MLKRNINISCRAVTVPADIANEIIEAFGKP